MYTIGLPLNVGHSGNSIQNGRLLPGKRALSLTFTYFIFSFFEKFSGTESIIADINPSTSIPPKQSLTASV